jgi:hypothetical protein
MPAVDIQSKLRKIGQLFGVYVLAYKEKKHDVYLAEFNAYTRQQLRGTGAMKTIIRICRQYGFKHINLVACPIGSLDGTETPATESNVNRLVNWYTQFGFQLKDKISYMYGNEMILPLTDDQDNSK